MATIVPRPIIKSLGEDTSNKNSPSQTAIGEGVPYAGNITSSEPNGFFYIVYEAVKNLQRTGGMYGATIPYSKGQSCKVLVQNGDYYAIKNFVCMSASETTGNAPYSGATVTSLNGVDVYAGGVINTTYWYPSDFIDGYDPAITTYTDASTSVAALAAVNYKNTGRQYVNVTNSTVTSTDPETNRNAFAVAPTISEIIEMMDGIIYPKWATQALDVTTSSVRRLGSYIFRGQRVEAFGMFLSGNAFTDNGTSAQSVFWRSMSSAYSSLCVVSNTTHRDYLFTGTEGGTITPRNYKGRVMTSAGTPTLTAGTADARASLGNVQDDQFQEHFRGVYRNTTGGAGLGLGGTTGFTAVIDTSQRYATATGAITDGVHGTPRIGYNTRENTWSGPVPMVVTLVPYGLLTL
jgi:hypothetical protein